MLLKYLNKKKLTEKFKKHDTDCGSVEIQISSLSWDILSLTEHLKIHKKDFHSRKGLINKVNKRKSLLKYLNINNKNKYLNIIKKLNIRK